MKKSGEKNRKSRIKLSKQKKRLLQCYLCRVFIKSSISNLRRHIRLHGPVVDCFKCLGCGEKYQNKANLAAHWVKKHKANLGEEAQMIKSERVPKGIISKNVNRIIPSKQFHITFHLLLLRHTFITIDDDTPNQRFDPTFKIESVGSIKIISARWLYSKSDSTTKIWCSTKIRC